LRKPKEDQKDLLVQEDQGYTNHAGGERGSPPGNTDYEGGGSFCGKGREGRMIGHIGKNLLKTQANQNKKVNRKNRYPDLLLRKLALTYNNGASNAFILCYKLNANDFLLLLYACI
jgi:hypothetical protein